MTWSSSLEVIAAQYDARISDVCKVHNHCDRAARKQTYLTPDNNFYKVALALTEKHFRIRHNAITSQSHRQSQRQSQMTNKYNGR